MMLKKISKSFLASAILGLSFQASAWEWTLDFDSYIDSNGVEQTINAGTIIDDEYSSGYVKLDNGNIQNVGVETSIRVNNWNNPGKNLALAYNSGSEDDDGVNHRDGDLKAPFNHYQNGDDEQYNADGVKDNLLIIQESSQGDPIASETCDAESCTVADDEGNKVTKTLNNGKERTGTGYMIFEFSESVSLTSINFFDIEEDNETFITAQTWDETEQKYKGISRSKTLVPALGNDKWGTVSFDTDKYSAIDRFVVFMSGSGAISDIKLSKVVAQVSEPHTILLMLLGVAALVYRKRTPSNNMKLAA